MPAVSDLIHKVRRLRPPADAAEVGRTERVICTARLVLAVASCVAVNIDPTEPNRYDALLYLSLFGYSMYAGLLLVSFRQKSQPSLRYRPVIHLVDIAWISVISALTEGPNSPFFVFFTFVLLAAAYRWGFWETLSTGVMIGVLFFMQGLLLSGEVYFQGNRFMMRSIYLILTSVLLGYLAETDKRLRRENDVIARAMGKARAEFGITQSIQGVLDEILGFYAAAAVVIAVEESSSQGAYVMTRGEHAGAEPSRLDEILPDMKPAYFFPVDIDSWHSIRRGEDTTGLDAEGKPVRHCDVRYPAGFLEVYPFESVLAVPVTFGDELTGRLFVIDPKLDISRHDELTFLRRVVAQVNPAIYNVYLWRRLKAKAGAQERAKVARELHDGVIQSLIGLEMQLDVIRQEREQGHSVAANEVGRVQELLRHEIQVVRELMHQMRPLDFNPSELVNYMADMVDKFSRETGISAKFIADTDQMILPGKVSREVAQILQEALVNVRKHSGAAHVVVRLSSPDGHWNLNIIDDGRGFGFNGKLNDTQLDSSNFGPVVIRERVRLIGAHLEITSQPGRGAELQVRLPKRQ